MRNGQAPDARSQAVLRIPRAVADAILAHARESAPHEACGVLAGRTGARDSEALLALRVRNVSPHPAREFLLAPEEQLAVILRIEDELGWDVVGFYHSHPEGPARFSAMDEARATWPGATYVLAHLAPMEGLVAARLAPEGSLTSEPIAITPTES